MPRIQNSTKKKRRVQFSSANRANESNFQTPLSVVNSPDPANYSQVTVDVLKLPIPKKLFQESPSTIDKTKSFAKKDPPAIDNNEEIFREVYPIKIIFKSHGSIYKYYFAIDNNYTIEILLCMNEQEMQSIF